jgi:transcriptional regulator with XRE-family HTH domain
MLSDQIGALLREARRSRDLSQAKLAQLSGVSTRLVAEVERGMRPNVGLEAVLRLLSIAGVAVRLSGPTGAVAELHSAAGADAEREERAARAARRRETWTGRHVALARSGAAPSGGRSALERLGAVGQVSRQAHAFARAGRGVATGTSRASERTPPPGAGATSAASARRPRA